MFSTQIQNDDKYQAESYAERKQAESRNPSFWCFNALVPVKLAVHGFVKLQFALDVTLSLLCLALFFFVGSLLKVTKTPGPNSREFTGSRLRRSLPSSCTSSSASRRFARNSKRTELTKRLKSEPRLTATTWRERLCGLSRPPTSPSSRSSSSETRARTPLSSTREKGRALSEDTFSARF